MKQIYEKKKVYNVCGRLEKNDANVWVIAVEDKDGVEVYSLESLLADMQGTVISLKSEDFIG